MTDPQTPPIALPAPDTDGATAFETVLSARRTNRDFRDGPLSLAQAAQLLWSAQGITGETGQRTVPSAGECYPLQVHLAAGAVDGLNPDVYAYDPARHDLTAAGMGDCRKALAAAGIGEQPWLEFAAAVMVVSAETTRMVNLFTDQPPQGQRGHRYVNMEVGCLAQNVYLQAGGLDLGAVFVGGFDDDAVRALGFIGDAFDPLGLIALGLS